MFGLGPIELVIVGVIVLVLFGNRLPSVMRSLGQGLVELKKASKASTKTKSTRKRVETVMRRVAAVLHGAAPSRSIQLRGAAMFGLGPVELLIVGTIAVLLFGQRLPEVGRSLGKSLVEFKKGLNEIKSEVDSATYSQPSSRRPTLFGRRS